MIDSIVWLLAAALLGWAMVRLAGLERGFPLVQLLAFTPYVAVVAPVVAVVAAIAGRWAPAAVCGASAVALAAVVLPRAVPNRDPRTNGRRRGKAATCGPKLRTLTANLLNGTADAAALVTHVKVDDVDVLALQELSGEALDALDAAGIAELLPYRAVNAIPRYRGSGLLSRHPLDHHTSRVLSCGAIQTSATVAVPGAREIVVEAAHPSAPHPRQTACWERDLGKQPAATPSGPIRVLLGDFNATLDHAALRRLIATGYRDAAAERGRGLAPTWPFRGLRVPWVTIDHVFVDRRVAVVSCATRRLPGSDHRGVLAELVLPDGEGAHG